MALTDVEISLGVTIGNSDFFQSLLDRTAQGNMLATISFCRTLVVKEILKGLSIMIILNKTRCAFTRVFYSSRTAVSLKKTQ